MAQTSTTPRSKKLSCVLAQLILRTHGAATEIARFGGFGRAYAYKVVHGLKPPSQRFLDALSPAFARLGVRYQIAPLETDGPDKPGNIEAGGKGTSIPQSQDQRYSSLAPMRSTQAPAARGRGS
jgi:hypothetical protein